MISIVCVLYVIFILRNLQKNGWEREKSWITFGHTYYIYIRLPHICFCADLSQNKIIIKYKITNEKRKDSTSKCFPILLLFDRFCQQSCHFG